MGKLKSNKIQYIDVDVYTEAKKRIRHVIDTFDHVWVSFSGGKDSLACLLLVDEVYAELGIKTPVNVRFYDEELIPDDVIQFVTGFWKSGRYNFKYLAVPLKSQKFILGKTMEYVQWDKRRKWIRPKPEGSIEAFEGVEVASQYDLNHGLFKDVRGRVAMINGIRAEESMVRFRSCVNKKDENYICESEYPKVKLVKPIFDWTEKDVFKLFYEKGQKYCAIYDAQMWNKQNFRVSTPLHAESAKRFGQLRTLYPVFYQQLIDLFPEMLNQERYWDEYDRNKVFDQYAHSWAGIYQWIDDNLGSPEHELATQRVKQSREMRDKRLLEGRGKPGDFGGYPILYVFKQIVAGNFKRVLLPQPNSTEADYVYELGGKKGDSRRVGAAI